MLGKWNITAFAISGIAIVVLVLLHTVAMGFTVEKPVKPIKNRGLSKGVSQVLRVTLINLRHFGKSMKVTRVRKQR